MRKMELLIVGLFQTFSLTVSYYEPGARSRLQINGWHWRGLEILWEAHGRVGGFDLATTVGSLNRSREVLLCGKLVVPRNKANLLT